MDVGEIRYRLISALLQANGPITFVELVAQCDIAEAEVVTALRELVTEKLVVEGELIPDKPVPQYCWGARWEREAQVHTASSKQKLQAVVNPKERLQERELDIDSEPVLVFYNYVINDYKPSRNKRFLVFLQCSIRRPFSSSPSHASMKRAIAVATGYDPRSDFEACPVHVVVLASRIGPVPYELEDIYPANVHGGGVKHFDNKYYARVKPILANRIAQYIIVHGHNYEHITTFTEGRYGDVMEEARKIASVDFSVLPTTNGPEIIRRGKYWDRYWIQLYLEIVSWLEPDEQAQAEERLRKMGVVYTSK